MPHGSDTSCAVTVDLVVLTMGPQTLDALVVWQSERWALPGGDLGPDENLAGAAARYLAGTLGRSPARAHVEQLASYGAPDRIPSTRTVSVAYLVLLPPDPATTTRAAELGQLVPVAELLGGESQVDASGAGGTGSQSSAFDHAQILADGVERVRAKLEYTPLATALCPAEFTIGELRHAYQTVWGEQLDPRNFHRKVTGSPGFLQPTGRTTTRQGGRPAQLFRAGPGRPAQPADAARRRGTDGGLTQRPRPTRVDDRPETQGRGHREAPHGYAAAPWW